MGCFGSLSGCEGVGVESVEGVEEGVCGGVGVCDGVGVWEG